MPGGPLGSCWAPGSWTDTSWESTSWCPSVEAPVVVRGRDSGRRAAPQLPRLIQRRAGGSLASVAIAAVGSGEARRSASTVAATTIGAFGLGRKVARAGSVGVGVELKTFHATRVRVTPVVARIVATPHRSRRARYLAAVARQSVAVLPIPQTRAVCRDDDEAFALLEVA